jgi:homoserine O-acetyltransferase
MKAALTADSAWNDGDYQKPPTRGLRAIGRAWAGWALSQAWYRKHLYRALGHQSVEDFLCAYEEMFLNRDANNVLAMIATWQAADISANETFRGDFCAALGSIEARALIMPCETDLYFHPDDSAYEVEHMKRAELRVIPSIWGHYAGGGADPEALEFIDNNLRELLR